MKHDRDRVWVGIDVGKTHHWACAVDDGGATLLSVKVANDEADIGELISNVGVLAQQPVWAVDIIGSPSALLLALLAQAGQSVHYASGRIVAAMSAAFTGEGKTDTKDAFVIAETARLRRDLAVLTGHRADLIADRVRMINRLRDLMTSVFPSLEREFDYSACKGALVLLTGYASPDRIRRAGQSRLTGWLRARKVRNSAGVATRAVTAAKAQSITLPGQDLTAGIISELATSIVALDERVKTLNTQIEDLFAEHPQAASIQSMPGFGPFLGASLLVHAGDLRAFPSAGHLAAAAGLVPVPNDSGRRIGNLHRPLRYSRPLRHVFYLSAQTSMMHAGPNRDYYLKKRAHGATHSQAVIALARRRIDVLWALLRENRTWTPAPPQPALAA
ncbi:IS110 family RNA-guided transposase [Pseudonocardia phyllosphaerae]|uniref:IS110 family transposase n=1 Tax=Pseudonocardia phyllosphaerae TaxID=3390502 RepID=UPI00397DEA50